MKTIVYLLAGAACVCHGWVQHDALTRLQRTHHQSRCQRALTSYARKRELLAALARQSKTKMMAGGSFVTVSNTSPDERAEMKMKGWAYKNSDSVAYDMEPGTKLYIQAGRGTIKATDTLGSAPQLVPLEAGMLIEINSKCDFAYTVEEPLLIIEPESEEDFVYDVPYDSKKFNNWSDDDQAAVYAIVGAMFVFVLGIAFTTL
mmetsp:Transcript_28106/g.43923  ORF Transcript_28106/g.43923 Transcript_28106/m.43923 type:complete len:203 (-) Transcript_28106:42-650(-)